MPPPPRAAEDAADPTAEDLLGSTAAGPKALRGGAMRAVGYVISIVLSLISVPLLIRHLGIVEFGRYMTVLGIVTVANGLTDAGLANITLREWSTLRGAERTRVMRSLLGIRLQLSALGVLVAIGFAAAAGYRETLVIGTAIAGVGLSMQAISDVLTVGLQGELRFGWPAMIDITRQALSVALIVALVLAGAGVLAFWAVTIPAGVLTVALAARLVYGRMPLRPRWRDSTWWPLVRAALPYSAAIALNTLYFRVTLIVMSLSASGHQTGYFATSFQVTQVLVGVPALAISAAFPILARSASDDAVRFVNAASRILELAITVGVLLVLGVVLCAPFIIAVIAGAQGHPAIVVLQIQGLALFATFVSMATGFVLLALRRNEALLISNAAALVANIVLTLVLVPLLQARGAAIAAVVAESCLAGAQLFMVRRAVAVRISFGSLAVPLLGGLLGASLLLVPVLPAIARTAIGAVVYVVVLALFRRIPPEIGHALDRRPSRVR